MLTGSHDHPPKFLQIKQDDKFFSRLLSKESSKGESSFRVLYYGGASGAIPFMWESQPGTPKHPFSDNSLPPLTPPPSYHMSPTMQKHSTPKFLQPNFRGTNSSKKSNKSASFSSPSMSSSFSSSYSLPSTPIMNPFLSRRSGIQRSRSAITFGLDEEGDEQNSPTSTLCFGAGNRSSGGNFRRYYPMKNMKKALSCIVGHGAA